MGIFLDPREKTVVLKNSREKMCCEVLLLAFHEFAKVLMVCLCIER